jgi:hypothetical protein
LLETNLEDTRQLRFMECHGFAEPSTSNSEWQSINDELTHVFVHDSASRRRKLIGKNRKEPLDSSRIPLDRRFFIFGVRITMIYEQFLHSPEPVLEPDEALVVQVRAAKIDPLWARGLAFFDESPEQKRHPPEIVKSCVRATVFINHAGSMPQSEYRSYRNTIIPCHPDLNAVSQMFDQVSEPGSGLREHMVAPPRNQQKIEEFVRQLFRAADFIGKSRAFCPGDSSLYAVTVHSAKDLFQARPDVELVEPVRTTLIPSVPVILGSS